MEFNDRRPLKYAEGSDVFNKKGKYMHTVVHDPNTPIGDEELHSILFPKGFGRVTRADLSKPVDFRRKLVRSADQLPKPRTRKKKG